MIAGLWIVMALSFALGWSVRSMLVSPHAPDDLEVPAWVNGGGTR